jgi:integrase
VSRAAGLGAGSAFTVCLTIEGKIMALTVKRVAKLLRAGKPGQYLDGKSGGVRGLYLCIEHRHNASWGLRYQLDKRTHWMGLGSALLGDGRTLDQAREAAKAAREKLRSQIDPLQARRAEQAAARVAALKQITFQEAAKAFIEQNEAAWKNPRHVEQWSQTLKDYAFKAIGALPVQVIDTPLVLKVIEPIWQSKNATASRLRGRIQSVLDWAKARGYRSGDNPAAWDVIGKVLPKGSAIAKVNHHPAMRYEACPSFVARLQAQKTVSSSALLFTILTAARTNEVVGARWNEIDLKNKTWTVPAERMKAGKAHKVPLSDAAVDLLRKLYRDGDGDGYLFIGSRSGSALNAKALYRLLARMHVDATVHGFRSSFRTWAAEQTNFPREVGEQALAHTISDKTERAYKRTTLFDKRRQLMAAWAKYITIAPVQRQARDNVVPIGR